MPKNSISTTTGCSKEIELLKRRREKAQDNRDIAEEAKICNAIGELYAQSGNYRRALYYHRSELSLSEGAGEQLGAGIAHRKVGECECELGNYDSAVQHQMEHLKISRSLGDLVEEQRALATLGRTYLVQSHSEVEQGGEASLQAGNTFLKSLDVCDRLVGKISDRELLEMRSRLYLNLGLVYENQADFKSARKFMVKALNTVKELGDSATVFQCHYDLGSLHLKERHPTLAVHCFEEALTVARSQRNVQFESETLREMGQAYLLMCKFELAKTCLKKVVKFSGGSQGEREEIGRQLRAVRKILQYQDKVECLGVERVEERMKLWDKLGDLCCSVKAFPAAIQFYGKQLSLAEAHGIEPRELAAIYVSLARTHADYGQHSQALFHFEQELEVRKGTPSEECDTWSSIAKVRESAGHDSASVMEAYSRAAELAHRMDNPNLKVALHKAVVRYCSSRAELRSEKVRWERELSRVMDTHPDITSSSDSDSECGLSEDSDPPSSLSSMESEEQEEEERATVSHPQSAKGVALRKKSRIHKRNEKGETLLHVATIEGNVTVVRQLIREGADVNTRDNCGWLPLHEACNHGYTDVVRCLVDNGALVNDPGGSHCQGVTPLIDAATNGHLDVVQLLVQKGAGVSVKDTHGRTVLDILEERLSSVAESGQSYDLMDEHQTIREFLQAKMKGNGCGQVRGRGQEGSSFVRAQARRNATQVATKARDRTGRDLLYTSDEEDSPLTGNKMSQSDNPFQSFTVGPSCQKSLGEPSRPLGRDHSLRGFFNPLGQVEVPALIPEEGEDVDVVDDWLIDDVGQPPAKRKKRVSEESEAASNQPPSPSQRRTRSSSITRRSSIPKQGSSNSVGSRQPVIEINSGDSNDSFHAEDSTVTQWDDTVTITQGQYAEAPLRIRVRIENKSFLIPCPRSVDDTDTTVGWLASQATERYYTQHGVRPQLTLTTRDGALLCPSDPIVHVVQSNEEVVGVVEAWHLPPLAERYQTACRSSGGVALHAKTLQLFQSMGTSGSILDLSHHGLRCRHLSPISRALQGQYSLSSLILTGNRIRDEGTRHLATGLAGLGGLRVLDLTCTGITAQGLGYLAWPSSDALSPWCGLQMLALGYNHLGSTSGRALAHLLGHCTGLQELYLDSCGLSATVFHGLTGLGEALQSLSGLVVVSVSGNPLGTEGVPLLLRSIPTGRLSRLCLASTCQEIGETLGEPGVQTFFTEAGKSLEHLDLSHCGLVDIYMAALVQCLERCVRLRELKMAGSGITWSDGVTELCRYLSSSGILFILDLSGNTGLGNPGCLQCLKACGTLSHLNLAECGMSSPLPRGVIRAVRGVKTVNLSGNTIDSTDRMLMTP